MGGLAEAPVPQPPACPSSWPAPKLASISCEPGTSLEAVSRTDTALPVSTRSAEGRPATRCALCTRPPPPAVRPPPPAHPRRPCVPRHLVSSMTTVRPTSSGAAFSARTLLGTPQI